VHGAGTIVFGEADMELGELRCVAAENGLFASAVLQAGEVGLQFARRLFGQAIDDPVSLALCFDEVAGLEIAEMFGDFYLRLTENFLQMADTQRTTAEQCEDAQACAVAETFIDPEQIHVGNMRLKIYSARGILLRLSDLFFSKHRGQKTSGRVTQSAGGRRNQVNALQR